MAAAEPSRLKRIYHVQEAGSQRCTNSSKHRNKQLCDVMRIPLWTSPRRKGNIYHQPVYRPVKWKSLEVLARAPDGSVRRLLGESHMDVWELVSPLMEEFDIREPKVNMADTGVPVDLTASAALLGNDAIVVEDGEIKRDPRSATDPRLAVVEDILYSEKEYCHTLKSVCDLYEKPLRKFLSLDNKDYRAFFDWVEPLCSLSKLVINKLENALEFWDPDHTKIGSIFSKQLWNKYEEYQHIFRNTTLPLLREKEEADEDFVALCRLRQGAAKCSLDDLLRLPLDRLAQYEQYLSQLAEQTAEDHPDTIDTYRAASKAKKMVKRTEAAKEETDLDRIQDLFPNDNLRLHDRDPLSPKKNLLRTKSAAASKLQKALPGKSKMFPNDANPPKNDGGTSQRRPSRQEFIRNFIMEGAVQFTVGVQSQDRHLFLLSDLLIVAKPRSGGTYRLKEKVLVCELWTSNCIEDVSEISLNREMSFVLGWPTVNVAVTFSSPHTKQLWEERLKQLISESKEKEGRTVTSVQFSLCNQTSRENSTASHYVTLKINNRQTAKDCIKLILEQLGHNGTTDYQLWIKSNKDDAPYPLIGHEYPFCIKMSFIRGLLQRSDLDLRNLNNISTDTKCTFILRRKSQKATTYTSSQFTKKQKKQRRTTLIGWPFKRNSNVKQDSVDSGHSSPPPGNLFGQDLSKLSINKAIPSPIMAILTQLFQKGPFTVGIFRKSANARCCRELKEKLEASPECDLRDVSVLVLASVLKEFLRSLPDCLLLSNLYHEWLDAVESQWGFKEKVLRLISQLPQANLNLLQHLLCVLWHISQRASENKMSAINLAVCIGPSLLTPPFTPTPQSSNSQQQDVTKKVPKLVAYLIENCRDIFGEHCIHLFGEVPERDQSRQDSGAEESDSFHSLQDIGGTYRRDDSSIDSLERDYLDDGEHSPKLPSEAKMSLTNLSRDSGLTLSDTQLYTPEDEIENELAQDGDVLRNKTLMPPFTKSTPHLEMTGIDNSQSCSVHGRTSGVSIDGSCHDVVKKRRHGMDCKQKSCVGTLFASPKGKSHYSEGNAHSPLTPSLSYSYGLESGSKQHCNNDKHPTTSAYTDVKHRRIRGRSLVRQPVVSAIEPSEIAMPIIRRSASEESLHQICVPQETSHQHPISRKYRTPSPPYQRIPVLSSSAPASHRDRHAIWFANQNRCVDWKRSQSTSKIDEIDFCHNNSPLSVVSSGSSTPHVSRSNSCGQDCGARSHGDIYSLYNNSKRVSSVCSSSSEASQRSHHSHISHGSNKSKRSSTSQTSCGSQGSAARAHMDSGKPCEPPSYQETINRQTLLRGIHSPNASPVDELREEQNSLSGRARQLYDSSVHVYSQKPGSSVETHHAVPVNIVNSDKRVSKAPPIPAKPHTPLQWTPSENTSHRLRHHPPVHIKDSQITRQPNYQNKKNISVITYYKQRDKEELPEDWRKEINWSVAQLRSIFSPQQQSSCQVSSSQKARTYHRSLASNRTASGTETSCCQNKSTTASEEESLV